MPDAQYMEKQQREVDANCAAMEEMLDDLIGKHPERYALMKDRKVVRIFDTFADAVEAGEMHFEDDVFSVQKITREVVLCPSVWLN